MANQCLRRDWRNNREMLRKQQRKLRGLQSRWEWVLQVKSKSGSPCARYRLVWALKWESFEGHYERQESICWSMVCIFQQAKHLFHRRKQRYLFSVMSWYNIKQIWHFNDIGRICRKHIYLLLKSLVIYIFTVWASSGAHYINYVTGPPKKAVLTHWRSYPGF